MWTNLDFRGGGKLKHGSRYLHEDPIYEFERDRLIGLGSRFGDVHTDRHTQTFFSKTLFYDVGVM